MKKAIFSLTILVAAVFSLTALAQTPNGEELIKKAMNAYYYPGDDGKADISMVITDKNGGERRREMAMVRKNVPGTDNQKYFIYFKEPGDVREMTFMVFKNVGKDDDRWLFVPSVKLVRQISADDKRSSFVGSDFNYEDVSGRSIDQDNHTFVKEDTVDGTAAYVVKSTPNDKVEYAHKLTWVSKDSSLPIKEEYYDADGRLLRTFTLKNIEDIKGFATPMLRTMVDHVAGSTTVITVNNAEYNIGLDENDFSERRMRRPVRSWIR